MSEEKKLTVSDVLEECVQEICEKYCRFPFEIDDNEVLLHEYCDKCPLNRLC